MSSVPPQPGRGQGRVNESHSKGASLAVKDTIVKHRLHSMRLPNHQGGAGVSFTVTGSFPTFSMRISNLHADDQRLIVLYWLWYGSDRHRLAAFVGDGETRQHAARISQADRVRGALE
jgi:hypothetical protein